MILAQNRLLPLSGNNNFIIVLAFMLITSCGAGKKTTQTSAIVTEVIEPNIKKDSITKETNIFDLLEEDIIVVPTVIDSTTKVISNTIQLQKDSIQQIPTKKEEYKIGVILPFYLNQIPVSGVFVNDSTKQLMPESKRAMDFYLGCKLAKQDYVGKANANIYFFDDKNTADGLLEILDGSLIKKLDYIVTPYNLNQVKTLAEFAKANNKVVISPTVNSMYLTKNNPFYYSINPSIHGQYNFLIQHISTNYPNTTIEVIYNDADTISGSINLIKNLIQHYNNNNQETIIKVNYSNLKSTDAISTLITTDTLSKRVFLFYSSNESFIKTMLTKLSSIKNPSYVFTNSILRFNKSLTMPKNSKQQLYCCYAYSTSNEEAKVFKQRYIDLFIKEPTELSYLGYDVLTLLFNKIEQHHQLVDKETLISNNYLQQQFNFIPYLNKQGEVEFYDNNSLFLYKYQNGVFVQQ